MAVWVRHSNLHFCFAKDYKQLLGNTDAVGAAEKCVKVSGILMLLFFPSSGAQRLGPASYDVGHCGGCPLKLQRSACKSNTLMVGCTFMII